MKHEPQAWAAITAQSGAWGVESAEDARIAAAETCRMARENDENPVPTHWWDEDAWWAAAETALAEEIKPEAA